MWPFKRKKASDAASAPPCPHCGSPETTAAKTVKAWRGERYVSYRCAVCGRDFYVGEPPEGMPDPEDGPMIEDEDALRAAEEELKRRTDEEGDHLYHPGGA